MKEKDLDQLKTFFSGPEIEPAQKERIKELISEKLANEINPRENSAENKKKRLNLRGSGIYKWFKTLWWRWHWKLGIPLIVLIFLGYTGIQEVRQLSFPNIGSSLADYSENTVINSGGQENAVSREAKTAYDDSLPAFSQKAGSALTPESSVIPQSPDSLLPPADPDLPKMITYNLNANIQVNNVTDTLNKLNQDIQQMGGYVVDSQLYYRESNEYGHFTAKIPAANFDGFRLSLPNMGKILSLQQTANDITNQYYDAQTRLQNWEAVQARYLEIMKQAKTIEEILKVEGSLANIRQQIEQLKGQLKFWNNAVQYSTVEVELQPETTPVFKVTNPWQPVSWSKTWKAVQDAILKTLSMTWNTINYGIVVFAYILS
ncbi:MAG TPA: DUF4349 domain-containing protein, partial [Desulfitobacteriaceae bacterium]|nr:DUF4349 domain-containing protein [Desulfitobacteriaceae bacterium]